MSNPTRALKVEVLSNIFASFESFCRAFGLEALGEMMDRDAQAICRPRPLEIAGGRRTAGKNRGKIAFHGGKVDMPAEDTSAKAQADPAPQ